MLFIPRAEEQLHKLVALVTSLATLASASTCSCAFDYDQAGDLQFYVNKPLDRRHPQPLHPRARRHLPAAAAALDVASPCCASSTRWDHFPEPGNPKAFLILILCSRSA